MSLGIEQLNENCLLQYSACIPNATLLHANRPTWGPTTLKQVNKDILKMQEVCNYRDETYLHLCLSQQWPCQLAFLVALAQCSAGVMLIARLDGYRVLFNSLQQCTMRMLHEPNGTFCVDSASMFAVHATRTDTMALQPCRHRFQTAVAVNNSVARSPCGVSASLLHCEPFSCNTETGLARYRIPALRKVHSVFLCRFCQCLWV
jgi:hypothetical protein